MSRARVALVLLAACGAPAALPPVAAIVYQPPPAPPAVVHDHAAATQILRAYGHEHALRTPRREPTAAELAAAADADPLDDVAPDAWAAMAPAMRMLHAYEDGQHAAWTAACVPAVATWWHAARAIDDQLAARLATPIPADLYAGLAALSAHRKWLAQRSVDPAFTALPMTESGAHHRLVAAQLAWAEQWRARPAIYQIAVASIWTEGWPLDALAEEQARFCAPSTWLHSSQSWPPTLSVPIRIQQPRSPHLPPSETGIVAAIDASGEHIRVTRRDHLTWFESVPPCTRVRCTGIDCAMDASHGWRDVCQQKEVHRSVDHAWTLHVTPPPPVRPAVGDEVTFYLDGATDAVLDSAARPGKAPSFKLTPY